MMTTNKKLRHILLPLSLALVLGGCVSFGSKAPPSMLVLTATNAVTTGTARSANASDVLVILAPEVPRKLDTNRVPVQVDDSSIAYIKDAFWADKPARLMQSLLIETVASKSGQLVLNEVDAGGKAQHFVSGSLLEFGVDAMTNEAVVVYDAVKLVRGQPTEKRRFESRKRLAEIQPIAAGMALNEAANEVAAQIADWVG
jgi:cholesterol transport system auxiliary component